MFFVGQPQTVFAPNTAFTLAALMVFWRVLELAFCVAAGALGAIPVDRSLGDGITLLAGPTLVPALSFVCAIQALVSLFLFAIYGHLLYSLPSRLAVDVVCFILMIIAGVDMFINLVGFNAISVAPNLLNSGILCFFGAVAFLANAIQVGIQSRIWQMNTLNGVVIAQPAPAVQNIVVSNNNSQQYSQYPPPNNQYPPNQYAPNQYAQYPPNQYYGQPTQQFGGPPNQYPPQYSENYQYPPSSEKSGQLPPQPQPSFPAYYAPPASGQYPPAVPEKNNSQQYPPPPANLSPPGAYSRPISESDGLGVSSSVSRPGSVFEGQAGFPNRQLRTIPVIPNPPGGFGLDLRESRKLQGFEITRVVPNSYCASLNIVRGEALVAVNEESVANMNLAQLKTKLVNARSFTISSA